MTDADYTVLTIQKFPPRIRFVDLFESVGRGP